MSDKNYDKTIAQIKKESLHRCEDCNFWVNQNGVRPNMPIGNAGICNALVSQSEYFYGKNPTTPFWADRLVMETASFDGSGCQAFKKKRKTRKKAS